MITVKAGVNAPAIIITMMKKMSVTVKLLISLLVLLPLVNYAQTDTARINIPMKNGKVNYATVCHNDRHRNKAQIYEQVAQWFKRKFSNQQAAGTFDKEAGVISGSGLFKIITSTSGNYYWLRFNVNITVSDNGCTFTANDYYEKPVEKGITNDYSKIEYRWWDYRQGHPWSTEDKVLFTGLNTNTLNLMSSLKANLDQ
ncbi:DUF4468 domain-containing protein [Mucilaginibacter sp. SP1R1]|uniref:DUF4468 domain-containing protein n=1 Tax=Mucilaginibacter sp. SP1R1 TaxID=2723091 RepID=UPI00161B836D|nr:DUF4468 domain-containing protein [Mucilaginibacter sp. SP1R1]MBB6147781.1 hypothetical protein [Mucilaginibacter sp. SP1R1]